MNTPANTQHKNNQTEKKKKIFFPPNLEIPFPDAYDSGKREGKFKY